MLSFYLDYAMMMAKESLRIGKKRSIGIVEQPSKEMFLLSLFLERATRRVMVFLKILSKLSIGIAEQPNKEILTLKKH